ncbi:MAG: NYN domain-containing protein [Chloroflexi bacterium]|nr:NYN domain-containing protein [Chloroflexota bacterium]
MANLAHMLAPVRGQGYELDYGAFRTWLTRGRQHVSLRVYTGLPVDKREIRAFLRRLQLFGFEIVHLRGKTYKDGSVKRPNADTAMITDLVREAPTYDEAVLVSGDGDFEYPVRALLAMGKRVQVVSTREHLARDLRESGADITFLDKELPRLLMGRRRGLDAESRTPGS